MKLPSSLDRWLRGPDGEDAQEALAALILAARADEAFRRRVLAVVNLPARDREPLVRTAVEEMQRRGEPAAIRAAFLVLASPQGAAIAARALARDDLR